MQYKYQHIPQNSNRYNKSLSFKRHKSWNSLFINKLLFTQILYTHF